MSSFISLQGIFVAHVTNGSPAAMGGLRFGDQILQIDNETVAGYNTDKVMKILKKSNPQRVEFAIRDRYAVVWLGLTCFIFFFVYLANDL